MTVVLAMDGDEAGEEASKNALLTVLNVPDDERNYLKSYVNEGKTFRESIKSLSNELLAREYQFWSGLAGRGEPLPDWMKDEFREHAEACMALINERSSKVSMRHGSDDIKQFNIENSITNILSSYGHQAVPGRSVRCPAHDDSSPSLSISKDNNRAYCFNQSCALYNDGWGVDSFELNKILGGLTDGVY